MQPAVAYVYDDKIEIYFNFTERKNPDDSDDTDSRDNNYVNCSDILPMCPPCQTRIIRTMVEPAVLFLSGQNARKNRKANKKRRDANFILRPAVFIPLYKVRKIAFAENHPSGNSSVGYAATFHAMEGKLFNDGIHNTIAIVYLLLNR